MAELLPYFLYFFCYKKSKICPLKKIFFLPKFQFFPYGLNITMNKDQLMLESIYMEITNLIQGNFGGDRYKKEALDVFRKYGEVREGDEVEGEDALVIAMLYNVAGDDWEYFEDLGGNVIITRFDSEDPDSNIIHRDFGNEEEFDLDKITNQAENNVTLTPKEFVEYIHNVL